MGTIVNDDIMASLNIRYVKLHFTLYFPEDSYLPVSKASAIRGGIGQMLLNANCIADRNCDACGFESECIVRRTMYSHFDIKPDFVTTGESVGYVLECENYEEFFPAGSNLQFNLILLGKTICYFSQYMQAIYALGQTGLGKEHSRFFVSRVTNTVGEDILRDNNIYMGNYKVLRLSDYVDYRLNSVGNNVTQLRFKTPLSLKYQGEFLREFNMDAIVRAIKRRIYILDCFEGNDCKNAYDREYELPTIVNQEIRPVSVRRYSTRQDSAMELKGIKGDIGLDRISAELLPIMLAGELIHIGKNTSFGFGRYRVGN